MGLFGGGDEEKKAKKKAQALYYKALTDVKPIDDIHNIDTQGARKLGDQYSDSISEHSKHLAHQADEVGRTINDQSSYFHDSADQFNKRVDELNKQLHGEGVQKFAVTKSGQTEGFSYGSSTQALPEKYDDAASAEKAAAELRAQPVQEAPQKTGILNNQPEPMGFGVLQAPKPDAPTYDIRNVSYQPISSSYHTLDAAEKAYIDLGDLSKGVNDAGQKLAPYTAQYQAIADKLRTSLQRDQRTALPTQTANPTGLLASSQVIDPNASPVNYA